jgi:hypothetical protein
VAVAGAADAVVVCSGKFDDCLDAFGGCGEEGVFGGVLDCGTPVFEGNFGVAL